MAEHFLDQPGHAACVLMFPNLEISRVLSFREPVPPIIRTPVQPPVSAKFDEQFASSRSAPIVREWVLQHRLKSKDYRYLDYSSGAGKTPQDGYIYILREGGIDG